MENSSISLESIQEAAMLRSGVVGNPYLAGGYLIGSSLLGFLIIIGAFLYNQRNLSLFKRSCIISFTCQENSLMGLQLVYSCLLTLLTMDALNLIVAIILGATLVALSCDVINCVLAENIWFLSRWFGVIIHLVNASLSIYNLHQPLSVARVRIAYSLVSVVIIIMVPLFLYVYNVPTFTLAAFMFLFALSIIVASRRPTLSPSTSTLKKLIMVVAMCNFLVVYVPTFILQCLVYTAANVTDLANYQNIYFNVLYFTNLHLIFDGLQCALFLKLPSGEEQQQQQQQLQEWRQQQWEPQQQQQWRQQEQQQWRQQQWQPQQQQQWRQQEQQQWRQQQWQPQQQQQWQPQQQQQWRQQQWQPQQQQQWRQQQWQPQQQQKLGFQNAGFTGSTNVYQ
ncbi:uncharacterized protein LOC111564322 [Amphiprion ocellaris]|uniref:uncharacterized protein LOC111564322 n=1 Tax=Amphiprion ocellaris TaxID=80972 RepID=UPI002410D4C2|nr:uncharacterized protein LOC111564322 [Amphiprion ocellaris]XP_054863718.1 uncharacterized protein LOC111564322 [Amphiprion ocellaris]XP_054863719.1 uncharacterized protein LOC111564322 [Amphiprion ocellaris]XP_054863720.1 uncharacterized protein LOC111564322 [Amphiprion ocellaris]XP_054863721.1 uncharacterized protein LOC111564322 [Amphiprion ocellaris]XP_054863722.1 uncharacterized protein LOC111564322 [Amphiprion ocellaris]XP_054863723.1 uncharacterized protein LOC111564322 [Amphiprion o